MDQQFPSAGQPIQSQQNYNEPAAFAQATGILPGQPVQQTFQPPQQMQQPASTVQAMQQQAFQAPQQWPQQPQAYPQQQFRTITPEEYNRQVEQLAQNKYGMKKQEVINDAVSAMKGVINMFGQQQQPQQESFWDTTTGKVAIGGMGAGLGIGGYKLISKLFGGNGNSGYTPSPQELNTVGQAVKVLFGGK